MGYHVFALRALQDTQNHLEVLMLVVFEQLESERFEGGDNTAGVGNTIQCGCPVHSPCACDAVNRQEDVVIFVIIKIILNAARSKKV